MNLESLKHVTDQLIDSSDNTGCSRDLTVVEQQYLDRLVEIVTELKNAQENERIESDIGF